MGPEQTDWAIFEVESDYPAVFRVRIGGDTVLAQGEAGTLDDLAYKNEKMGTSS